MTYDIWAVVAASERERVRVQVCVLLCVCALISGRQGVEITGFRDLTGIKTPLTGAAGKHQKTGDTQNTRTEFTQPLLPV